jgi:hypothetical protein
MKDVQSSALFCYYAAVVICHGILVSTQMTSSHIHTHTCSQSCGKSILHFTDIEFLFRIA